MWITFNTFLDIIIKKMQVFFPIFLYFVHIAQFSYILVEKRVKKILL